MHFSGGFLDEAFHPLKGALNFAFEIVIPSYTKLLVFFIILNLELRIQLAASCDKEYMIDDLICLFQLEGVRLLLCKVAV